MTQIQNTESIRVWPLIIPQINWPKFLGVSSEVLNRKISAHLDLQSQEVRCPMGFLSALGNFESAEFTGMKARSWTTKQLTFGFLIQAPIVDVLSLGLNFVDSEERKLFVVSATLERWIEVLRPPSKNIAFRSDIQRYIHDYFCLMGLKEYFL